MQIFPLIYLFLSGIEPPSPPASGGIRCRSKVHPRPTVARPRPVGPHRRDPTAFTPAGPTKRPGRLVTPGLREPSGGGRRRGSQVHGADGGRIRTSAIRVQMCQLREHDPPRMR